VWSATVATKSLGTESRNSKPLQPTRKWPAADYPKFRSKARCAQRRQPPTNGKVNHVATELHTGKCHVPTPQSTPTFLLQPVGCRRDRGHVYNGQGGSPRAKQQQHTHTYTHTHTTNKTQARYQPEGRHGIVPVGAEIRVATGQ